MNFKDLDIVSVAILLEALNDYISALRSAMEHGPDPKLMATYAQAQELKATLWERLNGSTKNNPTT